MKPNIVTRVILELAEENLSLQKQLQEQLRANDELRADNAREFSAGARSVGVNEAYARRYAFIRDNLVAAKDPRADGSWRFAFLASPVGLTFDAAIDRIIDETKASER